MLQLNIDTDADNDNNTIYEVEAPAPTPTSKPVALYHSASDETEELYLCCVSYVAKCNEEMTLHYADRLKLV